MRRTRYINVYERRECDPLPGHGMGIAVPSKLESDARAKHPLSPKRLYRLRVHLKKAK